MVYLELLKRCYEITIVALEIMRLILSVRKGGVKIYVQVTINCFIKRQLKGNLDHCF